MIRAGCVALLVAIGVVGCPINNIDNRTQTVLDRDEMHQKRAAAVLAVFAVDRLQPSGNGFRLKTRPLTEEHSICPTERFAREPAGAKCTAVVVRPKIVVTAAHCISADTLTATRFVAGYRMARDGSFPDFVAREAVFQPVRILAEDSDPAHEYSIVELAAPVAVDPTPIATSEVAKDARLFVIGHPWGLPQKIAGDAAVKEITVGGFVTDLDAFKGNSGSPVFDFRGEMVGILVGGASDTTNDGPCRRERTCTGQDCGSELVTSASAFRNLLP